MHYEELLKIYELDPEIFKLDTNFIPIPASDLQRDAFPADNMKDNQYEQFTEVANQPELESHSEDRTQPPVDCINCRHLTFKKEEGKYYDHCKLKNIHIDNPEIFSCSSFQRGQCKTCGLYDDGRCDRYIEGGEKSPEDECEFDMRVFM